jgi:outer membrane lipoprotein SlyB
MKAKVLGLAAVLAVSALNSGCAEMAPVTVAETSRVAERIEYGVVESIQRYRIGNDAPPGVGAVLGGIAGGVIGHQVGGGRGNDVATIAGALGGAYAGHQIQRANERERYLVTVRLDGGARLEVVEKAGEGELRVDDRVRVVNGRVHRE